MNLRQLLTSNPVALLALSNCIDFDSIDLESIEHIMIVDSISPSPYTSDIPSIPQIEEYPLTQPIEEEKEPYWRKTSHSKTRRNIR